VSIFQPTFLARITRALLVVPAALSIAALSLISSTSTAAAQEYTDIRRLGTSNAFSKPGPQSREDLQGIFQQYREEYTQILRDTNWPGDPADLFRAIDEGSFDEAQYPVGHTFEWMAIRKGGVPQATGPVRWAGSEPFEAFEILFESNGQRHRFLIPKACGNLALIDMRPVEPEIDLAALVPAIRIQTPNQCTGVNATVDVTTSTAMPEGATVELTMTRPNGQSETLRPSPAGGGFRWEGTLDDAGTYSFSATVNTSIGPTATTTERVSIETCEPTCNLSLTPPPMDPTPKAGRATIGVDMCQSAAIVGSLTRRTVGVYHTPIDGTEQLIETLSLDDACSTEYLLPEYGGYRFAGEVEDDRGVTSTCEANYTLLKPEGELLPFFTLFAGNERRWRHPDESDPEPFEDRSAPLVGGTVGIMFPTGERFAIFGQGGVAANLRDSENTSLFADFGANVLLDGGYFGGGVGVWDFNHGDTVEGSLFVHGGFDLSDRLQFNIEGRLFLGMLDMIDNNYVYLAGIRYFWTK
jgi:hypothetical protein